MSSQIHIKKGNIKGTLSYDEKYILRLFALFIFFSYFASITFSSSDSNIFLNNRIHSSSLTKLKKKNSCIKRLKHRWNDKKWLPYRHFYPNFLAIELIFHKKIPSKLISRPVNTQKHQGKNVIFVTINVIFPH